MTQRHRVACGALHQAWHVEDLERGARDRRWEVRRGAGVAASVDTKMSAGAHALRVDRGSRDGSIATYTYI